MLEKIGKKPVKNNSGNLVHLIRERHSARASFDLAHAVPAKAIKQILEAARWAPTAHNMQNFEIIVVDDQTVLKKMGDIQSELSPVFIKENYQQLSFSEEEFRTKKCGVLATTFPPSWRTPEARDGKIEGLEGRSHLWDTIRGGPVLTVVLYDASKRAPASEHDAMGFISLGCVMENMWLTAQSLGLGFHIISALSSNMVGDRVEDEARQILGFPEKSRIAFTCRIGYPAFEEGGYLRLRREVDLFAHHNAYGHHGLK